MSKDKTRIDGSTQSVDSFAGCVTALRASARSIEFDLEDKKKRTHTFSLDASSPALLALASAAYVSGKKLHVTAKASNGAGMTAISELRFGNKPKPVKAEKAKPGKAAMPKSPAEAAAAPAESKPASAA
jgi:hypothetical protein